MLFRSVAFGGLALTNNTTGSNNTAIGTAALQNATGTENLAIGYHAGLSLTTGDDNIYLGSFGAASESNTMRLGSAQTRTFLAGVNGVTSTGGVAVFINSSGQLGTLTSSRRYKEDVQDMNDVSRRVMQLRPVTFRYKEAAEDGSKPMQIGRAHV